MTNPDTMLPAPPVESSSEANPVANPVRTQPGKNGGTLKVGGRNPGSGRPPDEWKAAMRYLASRGATLKKAKQILESAEDGQLWASVWKFAGEQGYGRAHQTISKASVSRVEFALVDERVAAPLDDGEG